MRKPYIKIPHIVLEAIGLISSIISLIYAIIIAVTVDAEIPTHYDLAGEVDAYGPASTALIMPLIMLPVVIMMILLLHLLPPSSWSLPTKVNPGRELPVFIQLSLMVAELIAEMGIFTLLETVTFLASEGPGSGLAMLLIGAMTLSIVVHCILATKVNKV